MKLKWATALLVTSVLSALDAVFLVPTELMWVTYLLLAVSVVSLVGAFACIGTLFSFLILVAMIVTTVASFVYAPVFFNDYKIYLGVFGICSFFGAVFGGNGSERVDPKPVSRSYDEDYHFSENPLRDLAQGQIEQDARERKERDRLYDKFEDEKEERRRQDEREQRDSEQRDFWKEEQRREQQRRDSENQ